MNLYFAPLGTEPPAWQPVGTIGDLTGIPVFTSDLVPDDRILAMDRSLTGRTVTMNFTMSREGQKNLIHILRMDSIKWMMRQDLEKLLDDFATRWGIER